MHISCIAAGRVRDVSEHLDVGEKVWVKATGMSTKDHAMGHSMEGGICQTRIAAYHVLWRMRGCEHQPGGGKAWTGHERLGAKAAKGSSSLADQVVALSMASRINYTLHAVCMTLVRTASAKRQRRCYQS